MTWGAGRERRSATDAGGALMSAPALASRARVEGSSRTAVQQSSAEIELEVTVIVSRTVEGTS